MQLYSVITNIVICSILDKDSTDSEDGNIKEPRDARQIEDNEDIGERNADENIRERNDDDVVKEKEEAEDGREINDDHDDAEDEDGHGEVKESEDENDNRTQQQITLLSSLKFPFDPTHVQKHSIDNHSDVC